MGNFDVTGYLQRLGLDAEPPGADALRRLHAAHVERVPYEPLEIQLGRTTSLEPAASLARILRGRGGYCYHLNGAFSALLRALGYQVTRHHGGVQGSAADAPNVDRNHLALTVTGLPEDPSATWLVDAGLGDGIHEPLPLREGTYVQGPHTYRLRPSEVAPGGWRFDHDPSGSFTGFDFAPGPAEMADFAEKHAWLSTAPESGFVRVCVLQRRDAAGVDTLRALTLNRHGAKELIESPTAWWTAAADVFGVSPAQFTDEERARLWRQVVAQHEAHTGGEAVVSV
ncbi:arylamine N-acetyltransferase [Amycolatopsis mediterranei S699]|uniref:Arylamine N-acetyltransferase n=2 Tax=Amycolatopsis mediterranei TaxID=33910 RepID=A0A0H3DFD0_AMYMU|nr:arylamine N-acetyltransferase [Amycolatopsis mediterranei]ADJ49416.1 arylamine N-acetyltransferase [Amycolatopsis mediterranei U32]AEK46387.1 arylamine N-acetyltransferase [Amycolatopsis mediterranei S699]AFO81125.1 arylamine N-acetyltransferase [Amycolatopsis mediterranei S699]AGT88253.1 arylamine N-acetyltransferase [Amycolatopsis mediterranei RB]KDO09328.1 arylamine N-acetyltransferase [Amycolatopsis mediterranei]